MTDDDEPDRTTGFWAWVKKPWVRRRAERWADDEEADLAAFDPARVSDATVTRMVDGLRDRELMFPVTQKFERLGSRAVPALLAALSDPRFLRPYPQSTTRLPVSEVLGLLDKSPPAQMLGRLAELAFHADSNVRQAAVRSLGNMATPAALPAWLAASRDPGDDVVLSAVWGVDSALRAGRVAPEFAAGVFDRVAELLDYDGPSYDIVEGAAGVLVRLDPCRALPLLLDSRRFTAENRRLHDLLKAGDEHGLLLPPDRVLVLMNELRPVADKYFGGSKIGYLLRQLARQRVPDVGVRAAEALAWATPGSDGAKQLGRAVADVTAMMSGVMNATSAVLARLSTVRDVSRLTGPQRAYYAAWLLDAEVRNGGFAQYFVNSSGAMAGEAVAAFEAVGASTHADIVQRAVALFGPPGPAIDCEVRHHQVAGLSERQDGVLRRLDTEYYSAADDITSKLAHFASRHPADFTSDAG